MFPEIFYDLDFQLENANRSIGVNSHKYPFKKNVLRSGKTKRNIVGSPYLRQTVICIS